MAHDKRWVKSGDPKNEHEALIISIAKHARQLAVKKGSPNSVIAGLLTSLICVAADWDINLEDVRKSIRELGDSFVTDVEMSRLANEPAANPPERPS